MPECKYIAIVFVHFALCSLSGVVYVSLYLLLTFIITFAIEYMRLTRMVRSFRRRLRCVYDSPIRRIAAPVLRVIECPRPMLRFL